MTVRLERTTRTASCVWPIGTDPSASSRRRCYQSGVAARGGTLFCSDPLVGRTPVGFSDENVRRRTEATSRFTAADASTGHLLLQVTVPSDRAVSGWQCPPNQ